MAEISRPLALPRRSFLAGAAAAGALASIDLRLAPQASAADVYAQLLDRRRQALTGGEVAATADALADKRASLDTATAQLLKTLHVSTDGVWTDLPLGQATTTAQVGNMGVTGTRLVSLATSWASAGSTYHEDADLLASINAALAQLAAVYRTERSHPGNWWFWEIGMPKSLGDVFTLLGDRATAAVRNRLLEAVAYFAPDPNQRTGTTMKETGANRSDKALACIVRGLLTKSDEAIALGRDALSDVKGGGANSLFSLVSSGDGFYADGSFIQHTYLPYVGTYGGVALTGVAAAMSLLAGSSWAVADAQVSNLFDAVEKSFAPFQWDVRTLEAVRGRAVSRQAQRDYDSGFDTVTAILTLADSAPQQQASAWRSMVKGWLKRTTDQSVATNAQTLAASALGLSVLQDSSVPVGKPLVGITNTVVQERMVQQRPTWAAAVNTSSSRIGRYEWGNRENNLGWYQGDGALFLYHRKDPAQFSNNFWPTVDPYALPGITANSETRASGLADGTGIPRASNAYAGGVTLAGSTGTTAMDLVNATGALRAKKSWYLLADSIVCVGSGVSDTSGTAVRTVVENRAFAPGRLPLIRLDGRPARLSTTGRRTHSLHVDGHAGFVSLPVPGRTARALTVSAQTRSGTWNAINSGADTAGTTDEVTRQYVRAEFAHSDREDWYAYQILPQAGAAQTARAALRPSARVLLATGDAHLVEAGGTLLGHFFTAGRHGGYTVSAPTALGVLTTATRYRGRAAVQTEIVVSSPAKTADRFSIEFPFRVPSDALVSKDGQVSLSTGAHGNLVLAVAASADSRRERRVILTSPGRH